MTTTSQTPRELAKKVSKAFMILPSEKFLEPLKPYLDETCPCSECIASASEGLHSVISAAGLPFRLSQDSVMQRRFDSFHASERILALIPEEPGSGLSNESQAFAYESAKQKLNEFLETAEGSDTMRDELLYDLDRRLNSADVRVAAQELLVQTLISSWSIFESFARCFIITWLNENPAHTSSVLSSPELKDFFGRKVVDIQTIGDYNFDLSRSMGTVLFKDRRLDSLNVIRSSMKALFSSPDVQSALGNDLWVLNQRRHLFVHNRGVVDSPYITNTSDQTPVGEKLILECDDVIQHLTAVRTAITAVGDAASASTNTVDSP